MKYFLTALLFLLSTSNLRAETNMKRMWDQFYPGEKCVNVTHMDLYIVRSMGDNIYECHSGRRDFTRNVILKMHSKSFAGRGHVYNVPIKWDGSGPMKGADGFEVEYDFVQECK